MISEEEFNKLKKDFDWLYARYVEQADNEYMGILPTQLHKTVWDQTISMAEIKANLTLDDIQDGETFGKVLASSLQDAKILLSQAVGDLDDIPEGTEYGKVAITSIQAGKILLAEATGNLDNIANGTNYGKVALTSISAGKIIVAGLDSGVTALMFQSGTYKTNIEAWVKSGAITYIDGGKIYTGSIEAGSIKVGTITGDRLANTTITGGKIATGAIDTDQIAANAITAVKISVTSLSAIKSTLGTVYAGVIHTSRIYVGGGTNEDIYFEDSGIRFYDDSGQSIIFAKSGYVSLNLYMTASAGGYRAIGDLHLGTSARYMILHTGGAFQICNLSSAPTGYSGSLAYNTTNARFAGYIGSPDNAWGHWLLSSGW